MKFGLIGLGRMGNAIAQRAIDRGHEIIGFDLDADSRINAQNIGVTIVDSMEEVAKQVRIIWLMVPAGTIVEQVIQKLLPHLQTNDIIVDGGNSKFTDSMRRAQELANKGLFFLDCGTSGGLQAKEFGFSLMVGGDEASFLKIHSILEAIAAPGAIGLVGPSGAGHYVKMVHNGIEYALLEAYAEGFQLIKEGSFQKSDLDLEHITRIWGSGSIIRSWILDLAHGIFEKDQELHDISGEIGQSGTGKWTVENAHENKIAIPVIEESLKVREWSEKTGGNYATKIVALLRHAFGGHAIKKKGKS